VGAITSAIPVIRNGPSVSPNRKYLIGRRPHMVEIGYEGTGDRQLRGSFVGRYGTGYAYSNPSTAANDRPWRHLPDDSLGVD
jgi:hypothetical protein